jgi:hypothetical protein
MRRVFFYRPRPGIQLGPPCSPALGPRGGEVWVGGPACIALGLLGVPLRPLPPPGLFS